MRKHNHCPDLCCRGNSDVASTSTRARKRQNSWRAESIIRPCSRRFLHRMAGSNVPDARTTRTGWTVGKSMGLKGRDFDPQDLSGVWGL